jgi:hypothetical protein
MRASDDSDDLHRPSGLPGGEMVRRVFPQRSVFEVLLSDGHKLWDPTLRRIDEVLDDETLVDLIADALGRRWSRSRGRGRVGTPAEVVLRMLVLKHLYDWSFDECEREVRGSLVYRAFCRIDCARVPDAKTLIRIARAVGPAVLKGIIERLVSLGPGAGASPHAGVLDLLVAANEGQPGRSRLCHNHSVIGISDARQGRGFE